MKQPSLIDADPQSLPATEILKPAKIESASTSQVETKGKLGEEPKLPAVADPKKKPLPEKSGKAHVEEEAKDKAPELYMCSKLTGQKRTGWI